MQFRILGPFEVLDGERVLDVGGGKQRSVLALLLLHANQVVSSDRLVDELWTDEPPPSASKIVQVHVSRLRKALEGAGEAVLLTRGHGYELRVAPGQLDVERFQSLLEEGRAAVAAGDPEKAGEILRTALGLWRGPPLAEFAYEDFAQAEIARLEDLRLAALEERIEADLALGRHDAVVQELEQLACRHPLRERLRRQLMLALYRSGRQAEALDVYRQARQTFADDLGLEPSPLLQQLERAILTHDPALQPPARRAAREQARRRGSLVIAAGALLLVAAAISVTLIEVRGSGNTPGLASVVPDSLAIVDPKTNEITGEVPIPGGPSLVAAGRRFVWVASDASRTISSVSADKPAVRQVVAANATPSALGADGDAVWVLDGNRRVLLKLEPAYGVPTRRFTLPRSPPQPVTNRRLTSLSVVAGAGALWITDGSTRLLRVDPDSSRVLKALDVHEPLDDVAVGAGAVWATSGQASSVFQIDPQNGAVKTRIPIVNRRGTTAPFPVAVTVGQGSVWVVNANTQTVSKIDPAFGGVTATIPLGIASNPSDIAAGAGGVWVANSGNATVARIDPRSDAVDLIPLGSSPAGVAVGHGRVWVTGQPRFRAGLTGRAPAGSTSGAVVDTLPASICSPLEFQGAGRPRYLIVSDLPFQGRANLAETLQMTDAIRFVLAQHHFRAGPYPIGYQSCDDSIAATGDYDPGKCKANAKAYAASKSVIGVIGTYNSGCTAPEISALARARGGPVPMISSTSTYVGLTHAGPGTAPGEPGKYYSKRGRNFVRVVAADDRQGAADALLARRLGVKRLYVLHDPTVYGRGIASNVRHAATKLGISVVGVEGWDPHARAYTAIARRVKRMGADAVFLGGSVDLNGPALVKSLRSVLGAGFRILTPDGFTPIAPFAQLAGPAAEGVMVSFPAVPPERLRGEGRRFVAQFGKAIGRPVEAYSVATAEAAEVLVDAIAKSDGSRASVTSNVFKNKVINGILGSFSFDRNGDTTAGAVTIYRVAGGKPTVFTVITPPPSLVR